MNAAENLSDRLERQRHIIDLARRAYRALEALAAQGVDTARARMELRSAVNTVISDCATPPPGVPQ